MRGLASSYVSVVLSMRKRWSCSMPPCVNRYLPSGDTVACLKPLPNFAPSSLAPYSFDVPFNRSIIVTLFFPTATATESTGDETARLTDEALKRFLTLNGSASSSHTSWRSGSVRTIPSLERASHEHL